MQGLRIGRLKNVPRGSSPRGVREVYFGITVDAPQLRVCGIRKPGVHTEDQAV